MYPAPKVDQKVTIVYSKSPPTITTAQSDAGEAISVDDVFVNAIAEWMLYRCYSKDAEYAADPQKAQLHLNAFKTQINEKSNADQSMRSETVTQ